VIEGYFVCTHNRVLCMVSSLAVLKRCKVKATRLAQRHAACQGSITPLHHTVCWWLWFCALAEVDISCLDTRFSVFDIA
jgi:hypothetical protein